MQKLKKWYEIFQDNDKFYKTTLFSTFFIFDIKLCQMSSAVGVPPPLYFDRFWIVLCHRTAYEQWQTVILILTHQEMQHSLSRKNSHQVRMAPSIPSPLIPPGHLSGTCLSFFCGASGKVRKPDSGPKPRSHSLFFIIRHAELKFQNANRTANTTRYNQLQVLETLYRILA